MSMTASFTVSRRGFLGGAGASLVAQSDVAATDRPRAAGEFVNSVGVNVHMLTAPYKTEFARFRELLSASGIRHLRDELLPGTQSDRWLDLSSSFGTRWHLLVSPYTNTVGEAVDYVQKLGVDHFSAVEGQNEGDTDWFKAQSAARGDWAGTVVGYQRELFQAMRQRYSATALPVVSPTLLDWKPQDVALIRGAADSCDIVGLHSYVQRAQEPETGEDHAALTWYVQNYRDAFKPGAPMMVTESGYTNTPFPGKVGVSETAASIYLPRLLLHNFHAGVLRTFLYEFMDGGRKPGDNEANYGLVHFDGTPKPAYRCIAALLKALDDPDVAATDVRLSERPVEISFLKAPAGIRRQVFIRRDGTVIAALWRPVRVWDVALAADMTIPPEQVVLSAGWQVTEAECMILNSDAVWTSLRIAGGRIELPVSGSVTLLRLNGLRAT